MLVLRAVMGNGDGDGADGISEVKLLTVDVRRLQNGKHKQKLRPAEADGG